MADKPEFHLDPTKTAKVFREAANALEQLQKTQAQVSPTIDSAEKLRVYADILDAMRRVADFAEPLTRASTIIQALKVALDQMGPLGVSRNQ